MATMVTPGSSGDGKLNLTKKGGLLQAKIMGLPLWVVAIALIVLVVVFLKMRSKSSASTTPTTVTATLPPGTISSLQAIESSNQATLIPSSGNSSSSSNSSTSSNSVTYQTNNAWEQAAVNYLIANGYPSVTSQNALSNYLDGYAMTPQQLALISVVLKQIGAPPLGVAPTTTTTTPTTTPTSTSTSSTTGTRIISGLYGTNPGQTTNPLNKAIVGTATAYNGGVWELGSDGGVFTPPVTINGTTVNAPFLGSLVGNKNAIGYSGTAVAIQTNGSGYTIVDSKGNTYTFEPGVPMVVN